MGEEALATHAVGSKVWVRQQPDGSGSGSSGSEPVWERGEVVALLEGGAQLAVRTEGGAGVQGPAEAFPLQNLDARGVEVGALLRMRCFPPAASSLLLPRIAPRPMRVRVMQPAAWPACMRTRTPSTLTPATPPPPHPRHPTAPPCTHRAGRRT